jgi:ABC-type polysaccharide/polyol phosphate transport system ATPase subunit
MARIELRDVKAAYPVIVSSAQRSAFATAAKSMSFGRLGGGPSHMQYVLALNGVSLELRKGQRLGIMGRNGSGKSTLLRLIAGILPPSEGVRRVEGSLGCVLSGGAGLDADKTGRQNMKLIAQLHGIGGRALKLALDEAIEFCELGPYIDLPVRTYSSGMLGRLTFAIATANRAEIMLIDEVIGAGDAKFIAKAVERARQICDDSGISIVTSHADAILRGFADTGIWMDSGEIKAFGPIDDVIAEYTQYLIAIKEI